MGYRKEQRVLHLVFAEPSAYAGLEVRIRSLSIGEFHAFLELAEPTSTAPLGEQERVMAERLVAWNVEQPDDAGGWRPVPATLDGLLTRDPDEVRAIKRAWIDAMTTIPDGDPLALSSTSGLEQVLDLPAIPLGEHPVST